MAGPKVFISSTCYDLAIVREQVRSFLIRLGHDPILSEYSDVLFDPRTHTHTSCIQEIENADVVVLIVGSRFGGVAVPEAISNVDFEKINKASSKTASLENRENLSVTQLEVLKAIEIGIPVFAFVDERVLHDHLVYSKNRELVTQIKFPSIEKANSAKYIFDFIDFLTHRTNGNSITSFSRLEEIENHLTKQWASLFQRLLREQRVKRIDSERMFSISEQIEDLKTAVISSIDTNQNREIARGVLRYRRLVDFLVSLPLADSSICSSSACGFKELLDLAGVVRIEEFNDRPGYMSRTALVLFDESFLELRYPKSILERLSADWASFCQLQQRQRQVIIDAIIETDTARPGLIRQRPGPFENASSDAIGVSSSQLEEYQRFSKLLEEIKIPAPSAATNE